MHLTQKEIELAKHQYPPQTRIRLGEMKQGIGMPEGAEGTVDQVDDMGHLHMKWDNGSLMTLLPDEDPFEMISSPGLEPGFPKHVRYFYPTTVRYFPLDDPDDYGYSQRSDYEETLSASDATHFIQNIKQRIADEELDGEVTRGLMKYYDRMDEVNRKILSAKPDAMVINGQIYGVALCTITAPLTPEEETAFKDEWAGQMSDGWGEGVEQRPIRTNDSDIGDIYVSFWNNDKSWDIYSEDEFWQQQLQTTGPVMSM